MKKLFKILCLFFVLIITLLTALHVYRFGISAPMEDIEYKKEIIKESGNLTYRLENLKPLVGEKELSNFIKKNSNNPKIYTMSKENITNGTVRANLHMHTTNSDGKSSVEYFINFANEYAKNNIKDGYMYIAITDHNTVLGAKEVIRVLQKNPNKYNNVKIIPGMEIFTEYKDSVNSLSPIEVHVLVWCINPYDKYLNKEFFKANLNDKWNNNKRPQRDFKEVISVMSKYGIPGIAHPIRYTTKLKDKKYDFISEEFENYSKLTNKILFTEGYYQSYPRYREYKELGSDFENYYNYIIQEAQKYDINLTGSTDAHKYNIFD